MKNSMAAVKFFSTDSGREDNDDISSSEDLYSIIPALKYNAEILFGLEYYCTYATD